MAVLILSLCLLGVCNYKIFASAWVSCVLPLRKHPQASPPSYRAARFCHRDATEVLGSSVGDPRLLGYPKRGGRSDGRRECQNNQLPGRKGLFLVPVIFLWKDFVPEFLWSIWQPQYWHGQVDQKTGVPTFGMPKFLARDEFSNLLTLFDTKPLCATKELWWLSWGTTICWVATWTCGLWPLLTTTPRNRRDLGLKLQIWRAVRGGK